VQGNMAKASKTRASKQAYISPTQLILAGFETPFESKLDANNRWVQLAHRIPWDNIVNVYESQMNNGITGASNVNGRVVLGCIMIKHMCGFSDEETILQIQENMYMQYFIGYSSFTNEAPFDSSLFVEIRKRLGAEQINAINNKIVELAGAAKEKNERNNNNNKNNKNNNDDHKNQNQKKCSEEKKEVLTESTESKSTHDGRLIVDATACPQEIAYPTDLNLLNDAREKLEGFIDILFAPSLHDRKKPRTYRKQARKRYLNTAMKKNKSRKEIRRAIRQQLNYVHRNLNHIKSLHVAYKGETPLDERQQVYCFVIQELYDQQKKMYDGKTHSVEDRIVSIHQPYVRPIVRGKQKAKVEFGAKIQLSLVAGYAFLDVLSWDAFNEGTKLMLAVENHKSRTGYYPQEVLADKIYCSRENRMKLKEKGIRLMAKPLGRPPAVKTEHLRPGERNPIEGKFGQAKSRYGLGKIKARLSDTSESWIASIILVLNLVKLAGEVPFCLVRKFLKKLVALASAEKKVVLLFQ
jgi:IS5 family transposase